MAIRFQADADLNQIIVSAVSRRVPAIDFRTATAAGLAGLPDHEVLARAARDGRASAPSKQPLLLEQQGYYNFSDADRVHALIVDQLRVTAMGRRRRRR